MLGILAKKSHTLNHVVLLDLGAVALVAENQQRHARELAMLEQPMQLLLCGGHLFGLGMRSENALQR